MRAALIISARDNVATALEPLEAGRRLDLSDISITTIEPIASGHKLALRPIAAGEPVIKYGSPIGVATADIPAGAHVHTHNLSGSRGRGDLQATALPSEPRLAEPPDDPSGRPAGTGSVPPSLAGASSVSPTGTPSGARKSTS